MTTTIHNPRSYRSPVATAVMGKGHFYFTSNVGQLYPLTLALYKMYSSFTMGTLPGVGIVLCHHICLTRDREKKKVTISTSFLFIVKCDKWLVSVPTENNTTPAFTVCLCFSSLPLASIFHFLFLLFFSPTSYLCHSTHPDTLAWSPPTLSLPS